MSIFAIFDVYEPTIVKSRPHPPPNSPHAEGFFFEAAAGPTYFFRADGDAKPKINSVRPLLEPSHRHRCAISEKKQTQWPNKTQWPQYKCLRKPMDINFPEGLDL